MTTFALPAWLVRLASPAPAPAARASAFDLSAGSSRSIDLRPGEALRVAEGRVALRSAARGLGDVAVRVETVLRRGDVYRGVDREAVDVSASERSRVERLP